eukprot:g65515.t1
MTVYFPLYMLFPRTCHRFVGYLEEEACHTYSEMLEMVDEDKMENVPAPKVAIKYWGLPEDASLRDVILVVRADEADHRLVNHYMGDMSDHCHTGVLTSTQAVLRSLATDFTSIWTAACKLQKRRRLLAGATWPSLAISSSVAMALTLHGLNCSTPNFNASFVRATEDSKNQCWKNKATSAERNGFTLPPLLPKTCERRGIMGT